MEYLPYQLVSRISSINSSNGKSPFIFNPGPFSIARLVYRSVQPHSGRSSAFGLRQIVGQQKATNQRIYSPKTNVENGKNPFFIEDASSSTS